MGRRVLASLRILPILALIMASSPGTQVAQAQQEASSQPGTGLSSVSQPSGGEYVGLTKCAACHFDQYRDWKGSEHNKAFEILPLKYRTDATCLECHTTAIATDISSHGFGVSCESCHGPGGEHAKFALRFVNEIITEEALTSLREKIQRLDMRQCVKCHISKAHKKHPPYDRGAVLPPPSAKSSVSFFQSIHRTAAEPELDGTLDDGASRVLTASSKDN